MRKYYIFLTTIIFVCLAAPLFAAVSTVNFTVQQMTVSKNAVAMVSVEVLDAGGVGITGTGVTLSVLTGTLNACQEIATTDVNGIATFSITGAAFVTQAILEAYSEEITSNFQLTVNVVVAVPIFNLLSTPTRSVSQVITGTKTADISTLNITCNSGVLTDPVDYPSATTWTATFNNLAEGVNIVTINALDTDGYSSLFVTATIVVDITSPSISLIFPTRNGYDNNSLKIEYNLSEKCITSTVMIVFTEAGTALDVNSPHTVTVNLTGAAGLNSLYVTGNDLGSDGETITTDALVDGAKYDVSIVATDLVGNIGVPTVNSGFTYDISPPASINNLVAVAYPGSRVALSWSASPSADVGSYLIYRGVSSNIVTANIGTVINSPYNDVSPVSTANNYYQVVAVDLAGNTSVSSNQITAGNISIFKTASVKTNGVVSSTIPGATITYSLIFTNNGYGTVNGISVVDVVPTLDVTFKQGSADSSVASTITYQHIPGGAYDGTDAGLVSGIKWNGFPVMNAGDVVTLSYSVIIQ